MITDFMIISIKILSYQKIYKQVNEKKTVRINTEIAFKNISNLIISNVVFLSNIKIKNYNLKADILNAKHQKTIKMKYSNNIAFLIKIYNRFFKTN